MDSDRRRIIGRFCSHSSNDNQSVADLPMLITPGGVITVDTDYMRLKFITLNYTAYTDVGHN